MPGEVSWLIPLEAARGVLERSALGERRELLPVNRWSHLSRSALATSTSAGTFAIAETSVDEAGEEDTSPSPAPHPLNRAEKASGMSPV